MAVELDTLEIRIEASASNAAAALDKLAASLKNVKNAMKGVGGEKKFTKDMEKSAEDAEKAAKKAEGAVSGAEKATEKLNQTQNKAAGSGKKFSMSLADITKATGKVQSGISGIFSGLKSGNASSLLGGFSSLKSVFSELKIGGGDGGSGTNAAADGATRAGEAFSKMSGEAGKAGDAAGEAGEVAAASAGGWQAVAIAVGVKVVTAFGKAFLAYQKLKAGIVITPFKVMAQHAATAAGKVGQLFSSLKRIATYRLLRTALKDIGEGFSTGLENAYYFSQVTGGLLAKSLDSISTEMLYLKNSIGAAVAPLINALAPAVEFVVDKFVGLVNVVNQFLSALGITGKWIKAIKYPTKYGDALDDATGSAKELKRTILGIDEINPLDDNKQGGKGKSGLTASDYSSMFEYATVDPQISDFAAKIREMIENGKWSEVGQTLAQKINNLITTADQKIKWENIGPKITKWLTNITDAFNGFVQNFDGTAFGNLVGDAIMTAFNTIDTAVNLTDFKALGDKITEFINGALDSIDGQQIGKTIHDTVKKVLNLATQVLNGVDKGKLSEDISGFFTGLDLADLIAAFKETFSALSDLLDTTIIPQAFHGIGGAILEALWSDMISTDPNGQPGWTRALAWLLGIGSGLSSSIVSEFGLAFGGNLVIKAIDGIGALKEKLANIDWKETFTSLLAGLEYQIKSLWNNVLDFLIDLSSKSSLTSWIGDMLEGAKADLGKTGVGKAASTAQSIYDQFATIFNGAGLKASEGFETGLNTDKTVGKAFGDNVNKNVDGAGNGKKGGNAYRGGVFGTLATGLNDDEKKKGNGLFTQILNGLGFNSGGVQGGKKYKGGIFNNLGGAELTADEKTKGNGFFTKLLNGLGFNSGGVQGGKKYKGGIFNNLGGAELTADEKTKGNGFFTKLLNGLGFNSGGVQGGKKYKGGIFNNLGGAELTADEKTKGNGFFTKLLNGLGFNSGGVQGGKKYKGGIFNNLGGAELTADEKTKGNGFFTKLLNGLGFNSGGVQGGKKYKGGLLSNLGLANLTSDETTKGNGLFTKILNGLGFNSGGVQGGKKYKGGLLSNLGLANLTSDEISKGDGLFTKILNSLGFNSGGVQGGKKYKGGLLSNLGLANLTSDEISKGDGLFTKILNALGFNKGGEDGATKYTNAFVGGLDGYSGDGGKKFGTTVSGNVYTGSDPDKNGKTFGSVFSSALDVIGTMFAGGKTFGQKISSNVLASGDGNGTAKTFRSSFLDLLDSATGGGVSFVKRITSNILGTENNSKGENAAKQFRWDFLGLFDSSTSGGYSFGKQIGENMSSGLKAGWKGTSLETYLDLTKFGGGTYTLKMETRAAGGIVEAGQMFIAQEAGPELIGNIGRKTAVANTTQMVDAMAQGVYQANMESNMLLRQIIDYAAEIAAKEYESGGSVTVESITQAMTRNNRRLGKTVVAVG